MRTLSIIFILTASICLGQTNIRVQPFDSTGNAITEFNNPVLQARLDSAVSLLIPLVNSKEFEVAFLKVRCLRKHGKSNCEIIDMIRSGQGNYSKSESMIDLKVAFDFSSKEDESRTDKQNLIHLNARRVEDHGVDLLAATLLKEYCHVLGFKNSPLKARLRVYTVPFRMERIVMNQLQKQNSAKLSKDVIAQSVN
jgi:hypothetical protein